ncbi:MAG TPA: hypothetical protein VL201_05725 [Patescibacteria group bacterium]|jgi:hypothetical protein|nr:hypothetical protein [Patescibacteria group bacterium]
MYKKRQSTIRFAMILFCAIGVLDAEFTLKNEDIKFIFSFFYKPESFFGENISSFNKYDRADRIFYVRHTLDANFDISYGEATYDNSIMHFRATVRNKAPWGTVEGIIKTTTSTFKMNEVVGGEHNHALPRNIFWMREIFGDFDLANVLNLPFENAHTITVGAFPYQLGRGIALGDAYAVGAESLGFYSDSAVDQFAYGVLCTNELVQNTLVHEFYVALLQNRSGSLSDTNAKILGQEYDRLKNPKRQFGSANFVVSGTLKWQVFADEVEGYDLLVQPYWLFNRESEQSVEFTADAKGMLGTVGIASEFEAKSFEFGFDCAINMGKQKVKGWDRNQIVQQSRDGVPTIINTQAYAGDPADPESMQLIYVLGSDTQKAVDQAVRSVTQNGKQIVGVVDGLTGGSSVFNGLNRFRDPYVNIFNGWMAVADAAYWFAEDTVRIAGTAGIASGDDFPNFKPVDGSYSGFVGLQELYSGNRVKSAFFLGGAGKPKRPFSKPTFEEAPDKFQSVVVSGFSNLMMVGSSVLWQPVAVSKKIKLHSNILAFWQETATGNASRYLGVEGNIFFNCMLLTNLEIYSVASFFVPGSFYTDRKDTAFLTPTQLEIADELDVTGYEADPIPGLNDHVAFTFNVGLKFSF